MKYIAICLLPWICVFQIFYMVHLVPNANIQPAIQALEGDASNNQSIRVSLKMAQAALGTLVRTNFAGYGLIFIMSVIVLRQEGKERKRDSAYHEPPKVRVK